MAARSSPSISDSAVKKATSKTWVQWFRLMDRAGMQKLPHTEIAKWLFARHLRKEWWCQMVTVTYEQARGLRERHQTAAGYQVSASKTLPISATELYRWWVSPDKRNRWLPAKLTITTSTPGKSVRIRWKDGTRVDVNLYSKGKGRSSLQMQHEKLPNPRSVKRTRAFWKARLETLATLVE